MGLKKTLLKLYYLPFLSKEKTNYYQKTIRDSEWNSLKEYIPHESKFLDIGCGAGYNFKKAKEELQCECKGIDPEPGAHGVGRNTEGIIAGLNIIKGFSENIPFEDKSFDVVFSSHVLEHVNDEQKSLMEMKRVLKDDGVVIIGMPTAAMAWINFFTQMLFTTHMRIVNVLLKPFINTGRTKFIHIFLPPSHSDFNKTILYDLNHYRAKNWERIVSSEFVIEKTIFPCLYPFPDYIQLFKMREFKNIASSVFFVCRKKK